MKLGDGHAVDVVVVRVGHDAEAVDGDGDLDVLDAGFETSIDLFLLDGAGGVGDVGLAVAELLEAAAAAGEADGDLDVAFGEDAELLGDGFADREHGAGAVNGYVALVGGVVDLFHHGGRFTGSIAGQHIGDGALLGVVPAEEGAGQAPVQAVLGQFVHPAGIGQVANVPDQLLAAFPAHVEPGEGCDVGLGQRVLADVDEQRAG